ncbi:MAG: methyltransferase domain-containing protein [Candidatus Dormibacteraeota bacterium]|nr:methyltransferase domain-containing protein [Candidatus Dormibacteraeota bacterium]
MFAKTQRFYDLVYSWKDYNAEVERLQDAVSNRKQSRGNRLLDVACGTGRHLELLRDRFQVEGVDLDPEMLAIARRRLPGVELYQGDFRSFDLGRRYDVVTCLFSSIGYAADVAELRQAITTMARHLEPGGLLVVEPFIAPGQFIPEHIQLLCAEQPDLKVARIGRWDMSKGRPVLELHCLVGEADRVEHLVEQHEMSLFRDEDLLEGFQAAGLEPEHDPEGLMGRGLFFGTRLL